MAFGTNRLHAGRLQFVRDYVGDAALDPRDVLSVELKPGTRPAFAAFEGCLGRQPRSGSCSIRSGGLILDAGSCAWRVVVERPRWSEHLTVIRDERPSFDGFSAPARRLQLFRVEQGPTIATVWHIGSADPPNRQDALRIQAASLPSLTRSTRPTLTTPSAGLGGQVRVHGDILPGICPVG
jgi:hypothetical protein